MSKKLNTPKKEIVIDATGKSYGRLATLVATAVRGKHEASYQPHIVSSIIVKIKNLKFVNFTGKKYTQKIYYRHSGYPGGIKTRSLKDSFERNPEKTFLATLRGMLPKNKHRSILLTRITFDK